MVMLVSENKAYDEKKLNSTELDETKVRKRPRPTRSALQEKHTGGKHAIKSKVKSHAFENEAKNNIYNLSIEKPVDYSAKAEEARNAFIVTLLIAASILTTSPMGKPILGFTIELPINVGLWHVFLSLIAISYSAWVIFKQDTIRVDLKANTGLLLPYFSVIVLFAYSVYSAFVFNQVGLFYETVMIITVLLLLQWLKYYMLAKSSKELVNAIEIIPLVAIRITEEGGTVVNSNDINEGELIEVTEGKAIPVDGFIIKGQGTIDYSPISGNQDVITKDVGGWVSAGGICKKGSLLIKAIASGSRTGLVKLINHAQTIQFSKPQIQEKLKALAPLFAFLILLISLGAFLFWPMILNERFEIVLQIAVAILLVVSLEALTLSPSFILADCILSASKKGISYKDAEVVEKCGKIDVIVFDGIGSLVEQNPPLSDIIHFGKLTTAGMLRLAASILKSANSVFSPAVLQAAKKESVIHIPEPENFSVVEGYGVVGRVETRPVLLGNERLMIEHDIDIEIAREQIEKLTSQGKKLMFFAADSKLEGLLAFHYSPRIKTKTRIEKLKNMGIKVALLTSENQRMAEAIAKDLGIDSVYTISQPSQRIDKIGELKSQGKKVAVVSKYSNENGFLKTADLNISASNISMHSLKNETLQNNDVIFLNDDIFDISETLKIGRIANKAIKQNIVLASLYNLIAIPIAAGVLYPSYGIILKPDIAALGMLLGFAIIVLNSVRFRKYLGLQG